MTDLFDTPATVDPTEGYEVVVIDQNAAEQTLVEDLQGIIGARWLADVIRSVFQEACYDNIAYGPVGTWDGILADTMPSPWRVVQENVTAGKHLWKPDARHPLGKWISDVADRMMKMPPPEILEEVLRRYGFDWKRSVLPLMKMTDEGELAVLLNSPKAKVFKIPGVRKCPGLLKLWFPQA